jgi:hypothetical protein
MASLYERLLGLHSDRPKIPVHPFRATMAEWRRGRLTANQASDVILHQAGVSLDAMERTEVQDLIATVPGGTTTANVAARVDRLIEIDDVLLLLDAGSPLYDTAALIRTRLGVPTR